MTNSDGNGVWGSRVEFSCSQINFKSSSTRAAPHTRWTVHPLLLKYCSNLSNTLAICGYSYMSWGVNYVQHFQLDTTKSKMLSSHIHSTAIQCWKLLVSRTSATYEVPLFPLLAWPACCDSEDQCFFIKFVKCDSIPYTPLDPLGHRALLGSWISCPQLWSGNLSVRCCWY